MLLSVFAFKICIFLFIFKQIANVMIKYMKMVKKLSTRKTHAVFVFAEVSIINIFLGFL